MSRPKNTIRVRIAIAVDNKGCWAAYGDSQISDDGASITASDSRAGHETSVSNEGNTLVETFHWVEADIPLPISVVVEGRVKRIKKSSSGGCILTDNSSAMPFRDRFLDD